MLIKFFRVLTLTFGTHGIFAMEIQPEHDQPSLAPNIPMEVMEAGIIPQLDKHDLLIMCQVNKFFHYVASADVLWEPFFHEQADLAFVLAHCPMRLFWDYTTYREYNDEPEYQAQHPLHTTIVKPQDLSWKSHYKNVFGTIDSLEIHKKKVEIDQEDSSSKKNSICIIS
jgi:hypothetical protein